MRPLQIKRLLVYLALDAVASAQGFKLNAPLTNVGDVLSFTIAPDSSSVVYLADEDGHYGAEALFSRRLEPGAPALQISGPSFNGYIQADGCRITPDGRRVIYVANGGAFELYSVPIDGSASPVKLNGPLGSFDVTRFQISPDGSRVVFLVEWNTGIYLQGRALYSVRADGTAPPVLLFSAPPSSDLAEDFEIGSRGDFVVFRMESYGPLYSVPIDGSASALQLGVFSNPSFHGFRISPDGGRILAGFPDSLHSIPIDGSAGWTQLCGPFAPGRGIPYPYLVVGADSEPVHIAPDSTRVVYLSDQVVDDVFELYSVPLDGSAAPIKLSAPLPPGGSLLQFAISPDSTRVVYRGDQLTNDVIELFSVTIGGGQAPVRLNPPLASGGDCVNDVIVISPDSSRVLYRADQEADEVYELFSVPIGGGAALRINDPFVVPNRDVSKGFRIDPQSQRIVYRGDLDSNAITELFSAPIDASQGQRKENGQLVPGGQVICCPVEIVPALDFQISPNGSFVVYRASQDTVGQDELYLSFLAPHSGRGSSSPPGRSVVVSKP